MSNITFSTKVTWTKESVRSIADAGGKQFIIDEPKSLGGTNQGQNPIETLLSSLGGCMNVLVVMFAAEHGVELHGSEVYAEGDLDPDGFTGKNPHVRPGLQNLRYRIVIDSPSPAENIAALIAHVERVCPVKDTLSGVSTQSLELAK